MNALSAYLIVDTNCSVESIFLSLRGELHTSYRFTEAAYGILAKELVMRAQVLIYAPSVSD